VTTPPDAGVTQQTAVDPVVKQFRDQISDADLKIVEILNKRIKLVAQLKKYKEEHDIDFVDPQREQWLLTFLTRANKGPISSQGLREIYDHILSLTKAELVKEGRD
jgi:chorismate mutase / prephenate dehydratase